MFDTTKIAQVIKQARIDHNMTQMQLADEMGVSYQAVSNWERGNTMPDISKLEDLCRVLDLTVEQLLGMESQAAVAVNKMKREEELTVEELEAVAPVLPPQTMREEASKTAKRKKLDLSRIVTMAPFLDEGELDELIGDEPLEDLSDLVEIAPFLSNATLDRLVTQARPEDFWDLAEIAPFLSRETLERLSRRCTDEADVDQLVELAPFLDADALEELVERCLQKDGFEADDFADLAPFLSKQTRRKIVKHLLEKQ